MKILHTPNLVSELAHCDLFVDTNIFMALFNYEELLKELVQPLRESGCGLITIPSVVFEFTRGSDGIDTFNTRVKFIDSLSTIYEIEKHLDELKEFILVLQRVRGVISYTDFLLCACLYRFTSAFLMTENHRDFPIELLDRRYIITVDTDKEIRNYGIYQLSKSKFNRAAKNILNKMVFPSESEDLIPPF